MDYYDDGKSSEEESDDSAAIQSLIEKSYRQTKPLGNKACPGKRNPKKPKKNPNSLETLKERITELMIIFETNGLFIPPPESSSEKGKVWSSRNYGADKKRQRKHAERQLLEERILQLEQCLRDQYGIKP